MAHASLRRNPPAHDAKIGARRAAEHKQVHKGVCGNTVTDGMMEEIMLANKLNMPVASLEETLAVRRKGKTPQDVH